MDSSKGIADWRDEWKGWRVEEKIGQGSFGRVYRISRELKRGQKEESALKVIRIPSDENELELVRRENATEESVSNYFRSVIEYIAEEFSLMYKLKGDSNIVSYEDYSEDELQDEYGWDICMRMELLTPLEKRVSETDFRVKDVIKVGSDICKALELCRDNRIIHRDIKIENVFYSKHGNYKLGDFGVARIMEMASMGLSKKGTPAYMAPEVYGGRTYNASVDIYSLGILLFRLLNNNRNPFYPDYPETEYYSQIQEANRRRFDGETIPSPCYGTDELAAIIRKACSSEPDERYSSPTEMREALEKIELAESENLYVGEAFRETHKKEDEEPSIPEGADDPTLIKEEEKDVEENTEEDLSGEKRRSHRVLRILVAAIVAVALCVTPLVYKYYNHSVPDLSGSDLKAVTAKLNDAGLEYKEDGREFSDDVPRGEVISQSIKPGEKVKKGTTVAFVISKGKPIPAPSLEGKVRSDAEKITKDSRLTMKVSEEAYSDDIEKNHVISQTPKAKTECEEGQTIKVVLSKGIEQVKVPDVVGKTEEEAIKTIEDAKLKVETTSSYSSSVNSGTVMSQSEEAGSTIDKNSTVVITVSIGPAPAVKNSSGSGTKTKKPSGGNNGGLKW